MTITAYEMIHDINHEAISDILLASDGDKFRMSKRSFALEQSVDLMAEVFPSLTEETSLSEALELAKKVIHIVCEMEGLFEFVNDDSGKAIFEAIFNDEDWDE